MICLLFDLFFCEMVFNSFALTCNGIEFLDFIETPSE